MMALAVALAAGVAVIVVLDTDTSSPSRAAVAGEKGSADSTVVRPSPQRQGPSSETEAEPEEAAEPASGGRAEAPVVEAPVVEAPVAEAPVAEPSPSRTSPQSQEAPRRPPSEAARTRTAGVEPARERLADEESGALPDDAANGPLPSSAEVAEAAAPRYYPPQQNADLTLTVEALGVYDVPVADSSSESALNRGAIHVPETPMPWEEREEKNVYVAGHRIGYPGTASRLVFYNLDKLGGGDEISLKDRSGRIYRYRVTEMFEVNPSDVWVMDTVIDRDIVTLQTCTPIPTFEKRLIVRADRI